MGALVQSLQKRAGRRCIREAAVARASRGEGLRPAAFGMAESCRACFRE